MYDVAKSRNCLGSIHRKMNQPIATGAVAITVVFRHGVVARLQPMMNDMPPMIR